MENKFDIRTIFHKDRPLSYSAIASFKYSPEQWYDSYVRGIRQESRQLAFGSYVDNKLQTDPTFLPQVERYPILQHSMRVSTQDIPLIGYVDGWDPGMVKKNKYRLKDDKTGVKPWDQKRADETEQLTCYAFLLLLTAGIPPEKIKFFISWLPTRENGDFSIGFRDDPVVPVIIETKRTTLQILQFGKSIKDILKDMEDYATLRMLSTPPTSDPRAEKV